MRLKIILMYLGFLLVFFILFVFYDFYFNAEIAESAFRPDQFSIILEICENESNTDEKNSCFESLARNFNKQEYCERITVDIGVYECYSQIARDKSSWRSAQAQMGVAGCSPPTTRGTSKRAACTPPGLNEYDLGLR